MPLVSNVAWTKQYDSERQFCRTTPSHSDGLPSMPPKPVMAPDSAAASAAAPPPAPAPEPEAAQIAPGVFDMGGRTSDGSMILISHLNATLPLPGRRFAAPGAEVDVIQRGELKLVYEVPPFLNSANASMTPAALAAQAKADYEERVIEVHHLKEQLQFSRRLDRVDENLGAYKAAIEALAGDNVNLTKQIKVLRETNQALVATIAQLKLDHAQQMNDMERRMEERLRAEVQAAEERTVARVHEEWRGVFAARALVTTVEANICFAAGTNSANFERAYLSAVANASRPGATEGHRNALVRLEETLLRVMSECASLDEAVALLGDARDIIVNEGDRRAHPHPTTEAELIAALGDQAQDERARHIVRALLRSRLELQRIIDHGPEDAIGLARKDLARTALQRSLLETTFNVRRGAQRTP